MKQDAISCLTFTLPDLNLTILHLVDLTDTGSTFEVKTGHTKKPCSHVFWFARETSEKHLDGLWLKIPPGLHLVVNLKD